MVRSKLTTILILLFFGYQTIGYAVERLSDPNRKPGYLHQREAIKRYNEKLQKKKKVTTKQKPQINVIRNIPVRTKTTKIKKTPRSTTKRSTLSFGSLAKKIRAKESDPLINPKTKQAKSSRGLSFKDMAKTVKGNQ